AINLTVSDGSLTGQDSDTPVITATNDTPVITSTTNSRVSEEGLPDGIADTSGNTDTTNFATASGTININDEDGDLLTVSLSGPSGITSGGDLIQWTWDGTNTLTGYIGTPDTSSYVAVMTVVLTAPANGSSGAWSYDVTLLAPVDHADTQSEDNLSLDFGIVVNDGNGASGVGDFTVIIEDDAPVIADANVVAVTDIDIPNTLIGSFSLTNNLGSNNELDFDGFTITARGFTSATDSSLTAASVFGNSDGIGVKSVGAPYHQINGEIDFRKFADGSEASEEIVITLDPGTLAYGVNIEFSAMFGGELEVGVVEFYRDGQLVATQSFSSDANDGDYAAVFEVLQGGFDQMIIKATDNGFNAAHGDNSDLSIKTIEFLGAADVAIAYASGSVDTQWGADGKGSLVFSGTDETGLLTATGDAVIITQSGNTLVGQTANGDLVFKVEFTPHTGQWDFYQYQVMQPTADGKLDFNVVATDGDGDSFTGHFAVSVQTNTAPVSVDSLTQGIEDTPLLLNWDSLSITDTNNSRDELSIKITALPNAANGELQHLINGQWEAVTVGMLLTSAMFDAGSVRFVPANDQADGGNSATGIGNQGEALANFTYIATDGSNESSPATVTIHIDARADEPILTVSKGQLTWINASADNTLNSTHTIGSNDFSITIEATKSGRNATADNDKNHYLQGDSNDSNMLTGKGGDDILVGGNLSDNLLGDSGDDVFVGGGLNDFIYGGAGTDTAIYSGNFADYVITNHTDHSVTPYILINDKRGIDASSVNTNDLDAGDHLYEVERLVFADGVYIIDDKGQITQLQIKQIPLSIDVDLVDTDGSETLTDVTISGIPSGVYLTAGTLNADGSWTVSISDLPNIKLQVAEDYKGDQEFTLTILASSVESSNSDIATSQTTLDISLRDYVYDNGTDGDNTITGTDNNDVIVSDTTGIQIVQGENYNIAFILDSSGSMGESAIDAAKTQLLQVFNTLKASVGGATPGTVNILFVDFDSGTKANIAVNLADADAITKLSNVLDSINDGGRTNYEAAFETVIDWFNNGSAASNTGTNLTYFITDGETNNYNVDASPEDVWVYYTENWEFSDDKHLSDLLDNYVPGKELIHKGKVIVDEYGNINYWSGYNNDSMQSRQIGTIRVDENGDYYVAKIASGYSNGNGTDVNAESEALAAFQVLNTLSNVEAIGIGNGISLNKLTPYDSDGNVATNININNLASVILGSELSLIQGYDSVNSGAGDDIIFGDLVQFDGIEGQGYAALQKFVAQQTGENAADVSTQDVHEFVTANTSLFDTSRVNDGDDILAGNKGDDILFGQGGNDELHGGSGNDILIGGTGNDSLDGGSDNDVLIGGLGNDTLIGGLGDDTFVWSKGDTGTDTIMDFEVGNNKLHLSDLLQNEQNGNLDDFLHFSFNNGNTTISIDVDKDGKVDQSIVLDGVDLSAEYGSTTDGVIINGLLNDGALIVDTATTTSAISLYVEPLEPLHGNMIP
ncbi:type I secretion C-terminal target domain-containing protein, partial [Shewanella aestuarii]